LSVYRNTLNNI